MDTARTARRKGCLFEKERQIDALLVRTGLASDCCMLLLPKPSVLGCCKREKPWGLPLMERTSLDPFLSWAASTMASLPTTPILAWTVAIPCNHPFFPCDDPLS